jgi:hypothetical protein
MRTPKLLLVTLALCSGGFTAAFCSGGVAAAESGLQTHATQHPALYSFVDVFRLTVNGPMGLAGMDAAPEAPIRVAAPQQPAAEPSFAVRTSRPQPDKWLLLLAGLALAGWVAHRRLVHSL